MTDAAPALEVRLGFAHVRVETPSGERVPAWRCTDKDCRRLTFANPQRRCQHYREPRPPQARR